MFDPRTLPTNMTTMQAWILFALIVTSVIALYGDYTSTVKGLSQGLTEMNPIARFLFSKIGQPATFWGETVLFLFLVLALSTWHATFAIVLCAAMTASETFWYFHNSALLKKQG